MELRIIISLTIMAVCIQGIPLSKRDQAEPCTNVYPECPEWKRNGMCEQNPGYMQETCPVTCGFCREIDANKAAYSVQAQQTMENTGDTSSVQTAQNYPPQQDAAANQVQQHGYNAQTAPAQPNITQPSMNDSITEGQNKKKEKGKEEKKKEGEEDKNKEVKDLKGEQNSDELDSQPDDEQATNEQTHPSSKHIEQENMLANLEKDKDNTEHKGLNEAENAVATSHESQISGSGEEESSTEEQNKRVNVFSADTSEDVKLIHDESSRYYKPGRRNNIKLSNKSVYFFSELSEAGESDESESSGEASDSGSGIEETSGERKEKVDEEKGGKAINPKEDKQEEKKYGDKAAEQERTENAEKYEDEEENKTKEKKPVQERSHEQNKNLMEEMLDSGKLQAVAITKGKTRHKVAKEEGDDDDDDDKNVTDIDLDFKETGLEHFSGSSGDDGKMHLTLRQTYDKKYQDKNSPAFKILSGNFEKDMAEVFGDESAASDVSFSEAQIEGNPRTSGKVRANFKFDGDYNKLEKVIKSGNINGLLVVKNSLEGPMLNLNEDE